jgi:hypothetical protein
MGAQACLVTLTDGNSSATIDPYSSQSGLRQWLVDGRNVANREWFWYRTGSNPEAPVNSLSFMSESYTSSSLDLVYGNSQFNIRLRYLLTGGSPGSGTADIAETFTIRNTSSSALNLQFFQYSDFLNQIPGTDSLELFKGANSKTVQAYQTEGDLVCDSGFANGANLAEAGLGSSLLDRLNDCSPTTFKNIAAAGPGYTTWVAQWNLSIPKCGSVIISKDIIICRVPEPSSLSLLALGFISRAFLKRKLARN